MGLCRKLFLCLSLCIVLPLFGGFTYSYSLSTKEGTVTGYDGTDEHVVIPHSFTVSEKYKDEDDGETHTRYHTISVTGIGSSAFRGNTTIKSFSFPNKLKSIGSYAFYGCTSLVSVKTPDTLTSLGGSAFYGCTSLEEAEINGTNLNLGSSKDVFYDCSGLKKVVFGDGVTALPIGNGLYNGPFTGCTSLEEVVVGSGVTVIPNHFLNANNWSMKPNPRNVSFAGEITSVGYYSLPCQSLSSLKIRLAVGCKVESYAFYGCPAVSLDNIDFSKIISIGEYSFAWCSGLKGKIDISNVSSIGERTFYGCSGITSVRFSDNLKSIGASAFSGCTSLVSVKTPDTLTSLGGSAFYGCTSLEEAEINGTNLNLGSSKDVFYDCSGLKKVVFGDGVTALPIGNGLYNGPFTGCTSLEEVVVGSGVTVIPNHFLNANNWSMKPNPRNVSFAGEITSVGYYSLPCQSLSSLKIRLAVGCKVESYAFYGCPAVSLDNIDFSKIISIGEYSFAWCSGLKGKIDISNVSSISGSAFYGCSGITGVKFSDNLKSIGMSAFLDCTSLVSLKIPDAVTSLGNYVFSGCVGLAAVNFGAGIISVGSQAFYNCTNASSFVFAGAPPSVGSSAFKNVKSGARGYYTAANALEWEAVIDSNGKWNGLIMKEAKLCTATYKANGGSIKDSLFDNAIHIYQEFIASMEEKLDPCPFVKEGYDFKGWAETENGDVVYADEEVVAFDGDKILYAVWEKHHDYRLRFESNGGIGEMKDILLEYGERTVLPACGFKKEGYTFAGWGIQSGLTYMDNKDVILSVGREWWIDDESIVGYSAIVDGVCKLYAIWVKNFNVRLVSNGGVLIGEDGSPVKDADGKYVTEVTQEVERNKFVSIMKNPFKRGDNIFLGWSRYPDIDLRKEVYENRKSLEEVLYSDEYSLYFDIENTAEEMTLYAIWSMSLTCSFYNEGSSVNPGLNPEELKNYLYWGCLGGIVDGKPDTESGWIYCRHGESVELVPGKHNIDFIIKEGFAWIGVDYHVLLNRQESINLPSFDGELFDMVQLYGDRSRSRTLLIDLPFKNTQYGYVKFQCIPESSKTLGGHWGHPFDPSKVTIEIWPNYHDGSVTKPIAIQNDAYVTLPTGKYMAKILYEDGDFADNGFRWRASDYWGYSSEFEVETLYYKEIPVNFELEGLSGPLRDSCTVRFDPQGGKVDVSQLTFMRGIRDDVDQPLENAVITQLPKAICQGKIFTGWWTEPMPKWWNLIGSITDKGRLVRPGDEISADCTLYARWVRCDSSMTIDGDKLTGVMNGDRYITVPYTIRILGVSAFELVEDVEALFFDGDAPEVEDGAIEKLPSNCTIYVKRSSSGWDTEIPGVWKGVKIEYVDDVIPEITNESEIKNVFKSMADGERLAANINDRDGYNYFRTWAMCSPESNPLEIKDSPNAWLSYALGCESLIATAPVARDVVIDSFESSSTDGAFEFTVKLKDIAVGDGALEGNLKKVFDIEGREKLSSGEFSSNAVQINAAQADNGNVKFTVTPKAEKDEKPASFFFKAKMK